jgi:hypothetical protein
MVPPVNDILQRELGTKESSQHTVPHILSETQKVILVEVSIKRDVANSPIVAGK